MTELHGLDARLDAIDAHLAVIVERLADLERLTFGASSRCRARGCVHLTVRAWCPAHVGVQ